MIVLDTNVLSELLRPEPNPVVQEWLNRQVVETLYLASVTVAELFFGVAVLPDGKRKAVLEQAVQQTVALFGERILPFDTAAARCHAALAVRARSLGKGFPTPDGYIAAIAACRNFAVATRDVAPYLAGGVTVINPWEA